jgi:hypothetical protein
MPCQSHDAVRDNLARQSPRSPSWRSRSHLGENGIYDGRTSRRLPAKPVTAAAAFLGNRDVWDHEKLRLSNCSTSTDGHSNGRFLPSTRSGAVLADQPHKGAAI